MKKKIKSDKWKLDKFGKIMLILMCIAYFLGIYTTNNFIIYFTIIANILYFALDIGSYINNKKNERRRGVKI
jgi:hypothetical protein